MVTSGGGELVKAKLVVVSDAGSDPSELEFQFNPSQIVVEKFALKAKQGAKGSDSQKADDQASPPWKIHIKNIVFDTYESRKNVKTEYIDALERMCGYYSATHKTPTLLFVWGEFLSQCDEKNQFDCKVEKMDCTYTMFLNNARPVRAKVNLTLVEDQKHKDQRMKKPMQSPDHAKFRVVRRGDTLHSIAYEEYDNAAEWRRIADFNNIDDPMALKPGTKLLVPPIIR